ncbi:Response regulator receiver domain-containing protein [Sulfitobacter marinus]|uniref:Response regulator receiver domain-containing protein n=1 Tax=Sulfitobacter marinus TaxID=394264 RepID=A0A1I6U5P1_9RHOB|nr:response regulator [Sulfitobacter marinus]SFS96678.1 Response regulator receiver domain-containing protein [Sulfitobacter marinus]
MRILAVDDDPTVLEMLSDYLTARHGFDLVCAADAEQALVLLNEPGPDFDCFLLDIMLPGIDGIRLCAELRGLKKHQKTPILMITASTTHDLMERAFEAGATDFVYKPLNGIDLGARINSAGLLSESLRSEKAAQRSLDELTQLMKTRREESFDQGVPDVHDLEGFEHRLMRLSDGCYAMNLLAIKLPQIRNIFETLTPTEFSDQMAKVTEASISALQSNRYILGYAGNGVLVTAILARHRINPAAIQHLIKTELAKNPMCSGAGGDMGVDLSVHSMSEQRLWTGRSARDKVREYIGQHALKAKDTMKDIDQLVSSDM